MTLGELFKLLGPNQKLWDERTPMEHITELSSLRFPLKLYYSTKDIVVGNQERDQGGKLFRMIKERNHKADVTRVVGTWAHSMEFLPALQLGKCLKEFGLIK